VRLAQLIMHTPRRSTLAALACLFALPLLASCTVTIPVLDPRPNIALVHQARSIDLAFAPAVDDQLAIVVGNGELDVQSWHATLENAFRNGVVGAFQARVGPTADLTLTIDKADLEIGSFEPSRARIQYAATLSGADGTLRRSAGIASRAAPMFAGGAATVTSLYMADISASVAAMYEQLAKELFLDPRPTPTVPAAAAPRCVPGQSSACVGPKGCQGFQVCTSDGARYEPCNCGG
jgi:hypothetical protein